jgi:hypothetical protein
MQPEKTAQELLDEDPTLALSKNIAIKQHLMSQQNSGFDWSKIS